MTIDTSTAEKSSAPTDYKAAMMYHSDRCDALSAERDAAVAMVAELQRGQTYRYIGKDGVQILVWDLEDQRDALSAALTQSRAETAAAYERAVEKLEAIPRRIEPISGQRFSYVQIGEAVESIRALATTDQTAAPDTVKANDEITLHVRSYEEGHADGMRQAARIAEKIDETLRQGYAVTSANAVGEVYVAILAAIPKSGAE